MRTIEKAFGGRTFALAVFLAVYVGLLGIALMPRAWDGATAQQGPVAAVEAPFSSALFARR